MSFILQENMIKLLMLIYIAMIFMIKTLLINMDMVGHPDSLKLVLFIEELKLFPKRFLR
jgi:hypothetical protein